MLRSDFGSALMSGAQKSGALELVGKFSFSHLDCAINFKFDNLWKPDDSLMTI